MCCSFALSNHLMVLTSYLIFVQRLTVYKILSNLSSLKTEVLGTLFQCRYSLEDNAWLRMETYASGPALAWHLLWPWVQILVSLSSAKVLRRLCLPKAILMQTLDESWSPNSRHLRVHHAIMLPFLSLLSIDGKHHSYCLTRHKANFIFKKSFGKQNVCFCQHEIKT